MKRLPFLILLVWVTTLMWFVACSNSTNTSRNDASINTDATQADSSAQDVSVDQNTNEIAGATDTVLDQKTTTDVGSVPNGYTVNFTIGNVFLLGQAVTLATGYVMKVAREDLVPEGKEKITGKCEFFNAKPKPPKECDRDKDCAPEQRCLPRTDARGNPISGSDHCVTPNRQPLDVGTIVISGFTSGSQQFKFEPNDKAYKLNGQGDGKIPPSMMAYDTDYTVTGPKSPKVPGLGQFTATGHMPAKLTLTSPKLQQGGMMPSIPIDPKGDLAIKWTASNKNLLVSINVTGKTGYIACRVADTGSLTIPKDLISKMTFATGMMAMQNTLEIIRHIKTPFSGDGVKAGTLDLEQRIVVTMTPKQ